MTTKKLILNGPRQARGSIILPGSKSISNRALLLASLAAGETRLHNLLKSEDTHWMLKALAALGVQIKEETTADKAVFVVQGQGELFNSTAEVIELFLGNAGTAMRPLCAALAASAGHYVLTGEPRMTERPIGPLVDSLRQLGAEINYLNTTGYPPLELKPSQLVGGRVTIDGSQSSQFISALLMILPLFKNDSTLELTGDIVSLPYIRLTLGMMHQFGVEVTQPSERVFVVSGGQQYQSPGDYLIEGDASSASYFLAAAAIAGGEVCVEGVGSASLQGDREFAQVLAAMGAEIALEPHCIRVRKGELKGGDFDLNAIPDAAMTIATTALFAKGKTTIRNIENWRFKETDRLAAMATELRKVGASVIEGQDFIEITPPSQIEHGQIETYNDHRMAMCFSLLAFAPVGVTILDPDCCAKTYPNYFSDFERITTDTPRS
ncbi:MAG: 3-phosphoshikimate 1-carboxyvinyltransferase [Idiomarina sp.]|nr:3-phosphoshikimate 1-carboxyvinyltransferase [Idiomarina sp.]